MTVSPFDAPPTSPRPAGPLGAAPGASRRAEAAAQRREAALARLTARRMPLPGQPGAPTPAPPAHGHPATVRRPLDDPRARGHMHLVTPAATTRPSPPAPSRPAPAFGGTHSAHPPTPEASSPGVVVRRRPGLTDREIQVLRTWLLTDSKIAVAEELTISIGTVNTHLTRIRAKYTAVDRTARTKAALAARAIQDGIMSLDEL
ncbi:helix-turn-helix transcriptional regulator [Gordonia sp. PKS22-38]|uniref:Helix-turn-helix transcriptional regulator n=1 Tax=Gordonia prachuapensis TaxID=3115651 RepID=A0ABU7MSL3_9ACTN|nr:helix-turn-helix transcriptional regulator [Gordonia sp. PKS22-38]